MGDLVAELDALADATADALARLRDGDEAGVVDMLARRERLLLRLQDEPEAAPSALFGAVQRALALDADVVASLRAWQTKVGHDLDRLTHVRQLLKSYGPTRAGGPLFVERL